MGEKIDDTRYWLERHEEKGEELASVGQKSYSDKANYYMYKLVLERYEVILEQLKFPEQTVRVLDAGGGRGIYLDLFLKKKYQVTIADISPVAIGHVKAKYGNAINAIACDLLELPQDERYDMVHCFDVLYHVLDDDKWAKVLGIFSRIADKYIILHELFLKRNPLITSKHVKFRPYGIVTKKLNALGFRETKTIPTHFWGCRLLTYRISSFAPRFFYNIDKLTLGLIDKTGNNWGSYHIKVFEKF